MNCVFTPARDRAEWRALVAAATVVLSLVAAFAQNRPLQDMVRTEQLGETARWMAALASQWDARLAAIKRMAEET